MDEKNVDHRSFARWYLNPESEDTLFPANWDLSALPVRSAPTEDSLEDKVNSGRSSTPDKRKP